MTEADLREKNRKNIFVGIAGPYQDVIAVCVIERTSVGTFVLATDTKVVKTELELQKELMDICKYYEGCNIVRETDEPRVQSKHPDYLAGVKILEDNLVYFNRKELEEWRKILKIRY